MGCLGCSSRSGVWNGRVHLRKVMESWDVLRRQQTTLPTLRYCPGVRALTYDVLLAGYTKPFMILLFRRCMLGLSKNIYICTRRALYCGFSGSCSPFLEQLRFG